MMATTARAGAYVDKMARVGASVQCVSRTVELFPTDMVEGVSIIAGVVRETKGVAQGSTLLLRGATSWLVLWLRESPLVSRKRRGPH